MLMMPRKKHHGIYEATAHVISDEDTCTECNKPSRKLFRFIAEHNAGELYTVDICIGCLSTALIILEEELEE